MAATETRSSSNGSRLFAPFRAIGLIANDVPVSVQVKGTEHFATTCVGKAFHIYNCAKLNLLFVGETEDQSIRCIGSHSGLTVTASGCAISLWKRGKRIRRFTGHTSPVKLVLSFGVHIVSVDEENTVKIWEADSLDEYLTLNFSGETFDVCALVHPSAYLNKVLLGSRQGSMKLWNIRSNKCIYDFKGWDDVITTIVQAPALDVVAVGLQSGRTILHNLKCDQTIMALMQDFGPVTAISFRTDGPPVMAVGSTIGHVSFWDLEERRLQTVIRHAHEGLVSGLVFLQTQPLLLSSGPDNTLKLWIFDNPDGSGRLLKSRSGHSAPPTKLEYYGDDGNILLSTGIDRSLRYTSTRRDEQCCEMSQGSLVKKAKSRSVNIEEVRLPPITGISSATTRERDWDNIATCHQQDPYVRIWSTRNKVIGQHKLGSDLKEKLSTRVATVVSLTSCGNFALVGYNSGHVEMFNVQSGFHRGCYGKPKAHERPIKGIATDAVISTAVTCCQAGVIKFWDFKTKRLLCSLTAPTGIVSCRMQQESSLLAVAMEDFSLCIVDFETHKIVRKFPGHSSTITDLCLSADSRWLFSSGMDLLIKLWDIPTGRLIDCFAVDSPAVAIAVSPTGDYLATAHLEELAVYLWANKSLFSNALPAPLPDDYTPVSMALPGTQTEDAELEDDSDAPVATKTESLGFEGYTSPAQLQDSLVTLSMLPQSRWKSILNLDVIKQRNKPREPPAKPKSAPFFLPTTGGLNPEFLATPSDSDKNATSKIVNASQFNQDTKLQMILRDVKDTAASYDDAMEYLRGLSPSALDVDFRCLAPDAGGDVESMHSALKMLLSRLRTGKDFELVESFIGLFIKLHATMIATDAGLRDVVRDLLDEHERSWRRCEDSVNQSLCLISFFKQAAV